MKWNLCVSSIVSVSALLMLSPAAWGKPATTDTSRGFAIRYADGRTTTRPLRPKGGIMTAQPAACILKNLPPENVR